MDTNKPSKDIIYNLENHFKVSGFQVEEDAQLFHDKAWKLRNNKMNAKYL